MNAARHGDGGAVAAPSEPPDPIACIESLFRLHGHKAYDGARQESVTALEHALQCAQLAEWAHAEATLVAAALLHDLGHFLPESSALPDTVDDAHELRAVPLLASAFDASVVEPVRLHVQAKRYLVAIDEPYARGLSPASVHSLALQGGAMSVSERRAFEALPHAASALTLRRWDDLAKDPGRETPRLDYYLALLREVARR